MPNKQLTRGIWAFISFNDNTFRENVPERTDEKLQQFHELIMKYIKNYSYRKLYSERLAPSYDYTKDIQSIIEHDKAKAIVIFYYGSDFEGFRKKIFREIKNVPLEFLDLNQFYTDTSSVHNQPENFTFMLKACVDPLFKEAIRLKKW